MPTLPSPPSAARCALLLLGVRLHLRARGFGPSVALARRLGRTRPPLADDAGARALADSAARGVATAAAFFPGRAVCLEQSLALYVVLRRRGVAAELRVGVHPAPFTAHAWVEVAGEPVNENPELIGTLLPFPALLR
ncbi:MAG TPA: lasso peptide biosynthesis B2 protein [Longimicrobiaceae bacterium]